MKNLKIALIAAAFSSSAFADISDVDMRVTTVEQGFWVSISESGEPLQGANVVLSGAQSSYITPENGIVFVQSDPAGTRVGEVSATLSDGRVVTQRVMLQEATKAESTTRLSIERLTIEILHLCRIFNRTLCLRQSTARSHRSSR
ncbi:hypothetical protein [Enterovibrio coralii]|uniref:Uncharacterized protein n=1 Tax=Enterovibrio coralii TaxID=294935 RepID=A0A135IBL2_9GAMM|nr:hypothetical protein [Enterovibrio coralii]KXF82853.1 hypothetical protein ATN88_23595 [Enterovibrio coralii]